MPHTLKAILFDLDNTLYDARAGLQDVVDGRITQWIMDNLGLPRDEAEALRMRTWREYGTTAKGLEAEYGVPPKALYDYAVSAVEPCEYLAPSPALAAMLSRLTAECHVFTNATEEYARKVLEALGVSGHFGRIFDIEANGWVCKPHPCVYRRVVTALGHPPREIALVEDNPRNLVPAKELGLVTVLVDYQADVPAADLQIRDVLELADALCAAGICA